MATSGEPLFIRGENLNIRELSSDQNPHVFVSSWAQRKMTSQQAFAEGVLKPGFAEASRNPKAFLATFLI